MCLVRHQGEGITFVAENDADRLLTASHRWPSHALEQKCGSLSMGSGSRFRLPHLPSILPCLGKTSGWFASPMSFQSLVSQDGAPGLERRG